MPAAQPAHQMIYSIYINNTAASMRCYGTPCMRCQLLQLQQAEATARLARTHSRPLSCQSHLTCLLRLQLTSRAEVPAAAALLNCHALPFEPVNATTTPAAAAADRQSHTPAAATAVLAQNGWQCCHPFCKPAAATPCLSMLAPPWGLLQLQQTRNANTPAAATAVLPATAAHQPLPFPVCQRYRHRGGLLQLQQTRNTTTPAAAVATAAAALPPTAAHSPLPLPVCTCYCLTRDRRIKRQLLLLLQLSCHPLLQHQLLPLPARDCHACCSCTR
jgi:hypothetical protein